MKYLQPIINRRTFSVLLLLLLTTSLQACLRFTPSRASLVSSESSRARLAEEGDTKEKKRYLGKDAFFSLDIMHKDRLQTLTKERSGSIKPGGSATYRIGIGDILELFVFETDELNRKVRVRPDGNISLPLLGQVKAIGLTEDELQQEIADRLDEFMHRPQVQLFIDQYAAHKVWVVGEVAKPGAYPLSRDNYSLIELISEAGGRTERASGSIVLIPEQTFHQETEKTNDEVDAIIPEDEIVLNDTDHATKPLSPDTDSEDSPSEDLPEKLPPRKMSPDPAEKVSNPEQLLKSRNGIEIFFDDLVGSVDDSPLTVPLRAGDTIVVPEAGEIQIEGEIKSPGSYPLSSRTTLSGAIAAAGGFSYPANTEIVEVVRELGSGKKAMIVLNVDKITAQEEDDIRLRDGDLVRVPSARGRFALNQVTHIISSLLGRLFAPIAAAP
jgi:protein involved in polysaccharide export with SLBB domain